MIKHILNVVNFPVRKWCLHFQNGPEFMDRVRVSFSDIPINLKTLASLKVRLRTIQHYNFRESTIDSMLFWELSDLMRAWQTLFTITGAYQLIPIPKPDLTPESRRWASYTAFFGLLDGPAIG